MNKILFTTLTIISSAVMAVGQDGSQGQPTINIGSSGTSGQPQVICYEVTNDQDKNEIVCIVKN